MHIKEIVMDGFKSYFKRTVVTGLDRYFTSITGHNGSGKSNVIDAIIFSLDLNGAKAMRAMNLKDLINIHRKECLVILKIAKDDKSVIEVSRSLTVSKNGGVDGVVSKYRINNSPVTKSSIDNLCKSLNISSNFIVMQGHISKLINIKPNDLKLLIEETAGTKNYQIEQERSKIQLEEKEAKLCAAKNFLLERINPYLTQISNERDIYERNLEIDKNSKKYKEFYKSKNIKYKKLSELANRYRMSKQIEEYLITKISLEEINEKIKNINNVTSFRFQINQKKEEVCYIERRLEELNSNLGGCKIEINKVPDVVLKYNLNDLKETENLILKQMKSDNVEEKIGALSNHKKRLEIIENYLSCNSLNKEIQVLCGLCNMKNTSDVFIGLENLNMENLEKWFINFKRKYLKVTEDKKQLEVIKCKVNYSVEDVRIFGVVTDLFDIKDDKYATAIYTVLGGRRNFLVVNNENTAAELISTYKRKISCIPLNKIVTMNKGMSKNGLINLMDTVTFDSKFTNVIKFLLGGHFVFENNSEAKENCFKHKILCVTLDGTLYDFRGTITGGKSYFNYGEVKGNGYTKKEFIRLSGIISEFNKEYGNVRIEQVENCYKKIVDNIEKRKERECLKEKILLLGKLCTSDKDPRIELEKVRNKIIEGEKEFLLYQTSNNKINRLKSEIENCDKEILLEEKKKKEILLEIKKFDSFTVKDHHESNEDLLENEKKENIERIVKYKNLIIKEIKAFGNESAGTEIKVSVQNKENIKNSQRLFNEIEREFNIEIIEGEECFIDVNDLDELKKEIEMLEDKMQIKKEQITMNPSNFELLEKNSLTVNDITEKINQLQSDRLSILKNIQKLDEIGFKENKKTFSHINKHLKKFMRYFYKDCDVLISEAYEIKVKLSEKNALFLNLNSLSGGQRSLIALCLIFSMLTFKPAPFYLFDEIDAALDLNYTQFIGEIIKNEFQGAQFIIVSLKNNMFDNANKLFKVYIDKGLSKIDAIN